MVLLLSSPISVQLQGSNNKMLRVSSVLGHHLESVALTLAHNSTSVQDIPWGEPKPEIPTSAVFSSVPSHVHD